MASKYAGIVQDELRDLRGNAMVGAVVIVRQVGTTTPATVYNNPVLIASAGGGDSLINDASTGLPAAAGLLLPGVDANGNYTFYADADVSYDLRVVWQGQTFDYRVRPKVVDEAYTSTADLTAALSGTFAGTQTPGVAMTAASTGDVQRVGGVDVGLPSGVDDTTAIHAARTAAGVNGVVTFSNPGTYFTTGISASAAGQHWRIYPGAVVKVKPGGAARFAFTVTASGVTFEGGGTIDGDRTNQTVADNSGVLVGAGLTDIAIQDLLFRAHRGNAVRGKTATGAAIKRMHVRRCKFTDNYGYDVKYNWEVEDSSVVDNEFWDGVAGAEEGNAIWVGNGSLRATIARNVIRNTARMGIEVWTGCDYAKVSDNTIDGAAMFGLSLAACAGAAVRGNTIKGAVGYGMELAYMTGCAVGENVINGNATLAVGMAVNASSGSTISTNVIGNLVGAGKGIHFTAGDGEEASDNVLSGNVIDIVAAASGSPARGIWLQSSNASAIISRNNIVNNIIGGTDNAIDSFGIQLGRDAGTMDRNQVKGNIFRELTYGIYNNPGVTNPPLLADNVFVDVTAPLTGP